MASETMENAISMEVAEIKSRLETMGKIILPTRVTVMVADCVRRCDNIQHTLEEGDPQ